jgi:hypothetical protein
VPQYTLARRTLYCPSFRADFLIPQKYPTFLTSEGLSDFVSSKSGGDKEEAGDEKFIHSVRSLRDCSEQLRTHRYNRTYNSMLLFSRERFKRLSLMGPKVTLLSVIIAWA